MISINKPIKLLQATGQSTKDAMSQKAVSDEVAVIPLLKNRVDVLEERQTLFIDHTTEIEPIQPIEEDVWFDNYINKLYVLINEIWIEIPLSIHSVYIFRDTNIQYAWSGSTMVEITVPLTKPTIESLLTGNIYSHTHDVRTIALPAFNIDLSAGEDFEKLTGMIAGSAFTISNPIIKKGFRLIITGGTLAVPTFTGYTVNWILTSLVTDYVPANTNYLCCEIRSAGQIFCFWGA